MAESSTMLSGRHAGEPGRKPASVSSAPSFDGLSRPDASDPAVLVAAFGQMDRLMWEANVLYGLNRVEELKLLAKAAQERGQEQGYALQIALLRLDGDREAFEDLAVAYAVQTGNSPPTWLEVHERRVPAQQAAPQRVVLKVESLMAENIIETTIKMESPWPLTLDFSAVAKMDGAGLEIFQESLAGRISRSESTTLLGIEPIVRKVTGKITQSTAQRDNQSLWSFCFNAHRLTGDQANFDTLALAYVERYGHDLPVWEDLREPEACSPESAETPPSAGHEIGDALSALEPGLLKELVSRGKASGALAAADSTFVLDLARVRRWSMADVPAAIALMRQTASQGLRLELRNLNELLIALLRGFGLEEHARLCVAGETN